MKNALVAALCVLCLPTASAFAATQLKDTPLAPDVVDVGGTFTVYGQELVAAATADIYDPSGKRVAQLNAPEIDAGKTTLKFRLVPSIEPGRYIVKLNAGDLKEALVPGDLRVRRPTPAIASISPTTAYRDALGGFSFNLVGQNFGSPKDAAVEVEGEGSINALPLAVATPPGTASDEEKQCQAAQPASPTTSPAFKPCFWVKDAGHQIQVRGYRPTGKYQGPMNVRVRVGQDDQVPASNWTKLVLARASSGTVMLLALALFALLVYLINWVIVSGKQDQDTLIHGRRYGTLHAFLIDTQSNTYSLSKFQLFAFSFAFVFSYLYVVLCQWLVQWKFALPDIPSNLAALLGISGGATLAASAATQVRGTKGAGDMYPSISDFVTTGGQVVPERFQFFIWTLIATGGFVALLLAKDPATIDGFPTIPDGVLYVMGVSAAAYVGGKVTRQAGPVIKNLSVATQQSSTGKVNSIVTLQGENLSTDADFFVDDAKLPLTTDKEKEDAGLKDKQLAEQVAAQANSGDKTFSSVLRVTILEDKAKALNLKKSGAHMFKIVNRDGQFAEEPFPKSTITDVKPKMPPGKITPNAENTLTVNGTGFFDPIEAKWTSADPKATPATVTAKRISDSQMEVTVKNVGAAGSYTLTISALGGEASTAVKVDA